MAVGSAISSSVASKYLEYATFGAHRALFDEPRTAQEAFLETDSATTPPARQIAESDRVRLGCTSAAVPSISSS
jgi:hypothetical protein